MASKNGTKQKNQLDVVPHSAFRWTAYNLNRWQQILAQVKHRNKSVNRRDTKKKYDCNHCKSRFVHLSGLELHKKKFHTDENSTPETSEQLAKELHFANAIKCVNCGAVFANVDQFERHSRMLHWDDLWSSVPLDCEDRWGVAFRSQLRIIVMGIAYICEFCDIRFADQQSLFNHEALHDPTDGFQCVLCQTNVNTLDDILAHRLSEPEELKQQYVGEIPNVANVYCCKICKTSFASLQLLYEHRYSMDHHFPRKSKSFVTGNADIDSELIDNCAYCGYIANRANKLRMHYNTNHAKDPCEPLKPIILAGENSNSPTQLGSDEEKTQRPYLCDVCGKTYTQSSHLWQHLRFHNGVRPFVCPREPCTRSFTIRPDLNDHIRKCHTGERPYECETCGRRFLTGSVYYQHRLIHRGDRRYACPDCDKRFYRADALKNHQRIHTGEKPYACDMCDRKFRQRGDREKHVRVKHMKFR
ncbi:testis-specific zinc finger protein topi-like [Anopheles ziemanni]|uniref:testis-specific zinc finger protein topi-like n=1 Tax=Anopheles coustani TaxID=139045 RepID=UPI0026588FB8|nr:testis-specific zinc finger protein topi-like [Anopheles coustani]XP_058177069.1 testis-specific zinc finger protein topi-like [Anopheles ziemanni]